MSLAGVRIELPTNQPIVLLREAEGERRVVGPDHQAVGEVLEEDGERERGHWMLTLSLPIGEGEGWVRVALSRESRLVCCP